MEKSSCPNSLVVAIKISDVELVRLSTHDGTVFCVQGWEVFHKTCAQDVVVGVVEGCYCGKFGTGNRGQRVEVESVDCFGDEVEDDAVGEALDDQRQHD
jgi:hypothetical protein